MSFGEPAASSAGTRVSGSLATLSAGLRRHGVPTGIAASLAAHRALAAIDAGDREASRLALRATLCASRAELAAFDVAFDEWLGATQPRRGGPPRSLIDPAAQLALPRVAVPDLALPTPVPGPDGELRPAAWSTVELLHDKDFAEYTDAERALAQRLLAELVRRGPRRESRRGRRGGRPGDRPDLRATLRSAARRGGEPFERRWRRPGSRPRRLVLVCDVSGSMAPYSRMLLQFAQACAAGRGRTEVFLFGTRLSRVTAELSDRDPDRALERAAAVVEDWSGGTRIGDAIGELNRSHGARVGRGSVVTILSDGWDRGDPAVLGQELARLERCAHRLIWLNPLKARAGYEPLVRGMAAALPHVDTFIAGNSLASLGRFAAIIEDESGSRPTRPGRIPAREGSA